MTDELKAERGMTLKDFRRLKHRDFTNGAVLDEIEVAIEHREQLMKEIEQLKKVHKAARKAWLFFRGYVSDGVEIPENASGTGAEWTHRLLNLWEAVKNAEPPAGESP